MVPMLMLYHEHDPDPEMRPEPIGAEQREKLIAHMAAGLVGAYLYFREHGRPDLGTRTTEPRNIKSKIGRNDPCPCGSGKKYKRCCGEPNNKLNPGWFARNSATVGSTVGSVG